MRITQGCMHNRSCLRCKTPVEVVKLPEGDFEAALKAHIDHPGRDHDFNRVLAFVQLFSPHETVKIANNRNIFRQGQNVDPAFYILDTGVLAVSTVKPGQSGEVKLDEIVPGECFGEMTLLQASPKRRKEFTVTCSKGPCDVVTFAGPDFVRLLEKSKWFKAQMEELARQRRSNKISVFAKKGTATSTRWTGGY